jgi:hypothetical protein
VTNKTIDFKDSAEFKAQASQIERQMKAELEQMKADKRHALAESIERPESSR